MLVLTPTATTVVNSLITAEGQPDGAGLRIFSSAAPAEGGIQVELASGPAEREQVLAAADVRIFVDPQVVSYLDDKVLDANIDEDGEAHFTLGVQPLENHTP